MPYCAKCGTKVEEEMAFCPKCGASLKGEETKEFVGQRVRYEKAEKGEKGEKAEKREKTEKREKHEFAFIGPLIGGLILIFLGLMSYLTITTSFKWETAWAFFLVIIGVIIIVGVAYGTMMAKKRHPKT